MVDFQVALDIATSISIIGAAIGYLKKLRESKRDKIMGIIIDTVTELRKLREAYREYKVDQIKAEILQAENVNKFNEAIHKFKLISLDTLRMLEDILYFHIPRLQKYRSDEKVNEFINFLQEKRMILEMNIEELDKIESLIIKNIDKSAETELLIKYGEILSKILKCLEDLHNNLPIKVNELLMAYIK